ncbi:hypothetical protein HWV62_15211 [Athelia sp. TMB]|nr:hypothetical protein HWV62_15211 [Athelia sp. TMB]
MGYGYPLYYTEPPSNLPLAYRKKGISIGDVGFIRPDGSFTFIFNMCTPCNGTAQEVNCFGVPRDFVPFQLDPRQIERIHDKYPKGSNLNTGTSTTTSAATPFCTCSSTSISFETAFLTVPDGAMGEDYCDIASIRSYSIKHAESWYEFINGHLGFEAPNGSLYVVTGCDKSSKWMIATDEESSSSLLLSTLTVEAGGRMIYSHSSFKMGSAVVRSSASSGLDDGMKQLQNQCLFVRGFKVMLREELNAWGKLGARVRSIPSHIGLLRTQPARFPRTLSARKDWISRLRNAFGLAEKLDSAEEIHPYAAYHPLDRINEYLLKQTQARVAITHESDWWPLSPGATLASGDGMLRRLITLYTPSLELGSYSNFSRVIGSAF